jgi:outer membrane protein OmpA-like peptidoglycan-associated protein
MRTTKLFWLVPAVLATALHAAAPTADLPGTKDPALFTRMPGFFITEYKESPFDAHSFQVLRPDGKGAIASRVEGHVLTWAFDFPATGGTPPSKLQIARNFQNAATKLGGKTMWFEGLGDCYASYKISKPGKETWVEVSPRGNGSKYWLTIVEVQNMQQDVVANADALKSGLADAGHVEVPGIFFDFNKSDIKPESKPAIDEVVKMLQANPAVKVWVVGHTDNIGTAEANVTLSSARAAAVVKTLIAAGVSAERLSPHGDGPFAPVASNASDDGRAKNRRVELVAQP